MRSDVRSIPPAPRRIRLRPVLAHRWPLLALGGTLVVLGSLIAWLMFLQSGGKMSMGPRLDAGPTARVEGTITQVSPPVTVQGRAMQEVRFQFRFRELQLENRCFVPARSAALGDPAPVEVLVADPNVARIAGGMLHLDHAWLRATFWIAVLAVPGALVLLCWLAGVFQLRQVLVHGDVSVGRVLAVERVPLVLPEMLSVTYVFRDHRAVERRNRHWVRTHGALGARLLAPGRDRGELPVLHDRRLPHWNRMLLSDDFLPPTAPVPTPPHPVP